MARQTWLRQPSWRPHLPCLFAFDMPTPAQSLLFGDDADISVHVIDVLDRVKPADKAQAKFQKLIAQIEQQRTLLLRWQDYRTRYEQRVNGDLVPLQGELWEARRRLALLFEDTLSQPSGLRGKRQRAKLQQVLIELIQDLLAEKPDPELEAIHDKHSDLSHAENRDLNLALSQDMIEGMFGVNLGDEHGATSMEELLAKAVQECRSQMEQDRERNEHRQTRRRKSRKAEEAEARREQAAKEVSQSVRDVYRKLASALHPDRETDVVARERKTEQMQRVNQAYEAGDLLALLNLQLEIEQIDASHLASLSKQRQAHYNQVLSEQLAELKTEVAMIIHPFAHLVPHSRNITPDTVDRALSAHIAELGHALKQIKVDLEDFKDAKKLGAALKDYHLDDGMDEFEELSFLMDAFASSDSTHPKKRRR